MGVIQPEITEHQENRDRYRNGWHHPGGQNEKQQIILERHTKARERIGSRCPQHHTKQGRAKSDNHGIQETLTVA